MPRPIRLAAAALLASTLHLLAVPSLARAQSGRVPIPTRTYIGFDPLGIPANVFTGEVENAVAAGITLGVVGSYIDANHDRFTTAEAKVRYYPGEVVLRGISIGVTAGATRFSKVVSGTRQSLTAPTLGLVLDDNWLLGRSEHFLVGTGLGVKRVLAASSERNRSDVDSAVLTVRLTVGFAF